MARIRTIKPEFFTSLTIAELPVEARLTFIGLWTHVDDEGRCIDDPRLIRAALWPLDDRSSMDLELDLKALERLGRIARYEVAGRNYLAVTTWAKHQRIDRPRPSEIPPPPESLTSENEPSLPFLRTLDEPSTNGPREPDEPSPLERKGKERKKDTSRTRSDEASRLPDGWTPLPEEDLEREYATLGGNPARELAVFRDYWNGVAGQKGRKLDWQGTWRNWLRRNITDLRTKTKQADPNVAPDIRNAL